jgi:hypothetical protein
MLPLLLHFLYLHHLIHLLFEIFCLDRLISPLRHFFLYFLHSNNDPTEVLIEIAERVDSTIGQIRKAIRLQTKNTRSGRSTVVAEKNILILVEKKKKSDPEFLSYNLMLNSGKKILNHNIYIMQHKNNQDRDVYLRMHCTIFHAKYGKITEFNSLILLLF